MSLIHIFTYSSLHVMTRKVIKREVPDKERLINYQKKSESIGCIVEQKRNQRRLKVILVDKKRKSERGAELMKSIEKGLKIEYGMKNNTKWKRSNKQGIQ